MERVLIMNTRTTVKTKLVEATGHFLKLNTAIVIII